MNKKQIVSKEIRNDDLKDKRDKRKKGKEMEKRSSRKKGRGKWDNSTPQADSDTSRDSSYTTTSTTAMSTDMGVANNDRVQVGQIFLVQSIDGRWMPAKILETRQTNRLEYFVHFENRKSSNYIYSI